MKPFGWLAVARLGLVQACLGSIVVLTTSTLNRVMVVELALPALLPGMLVALHYAVQIARPRMGHGSDVGGRRTPWILGGMALLALGGFVAACAVAWMGTQRLPGILLAGVGFLLVGLGVSAGGTSLLVLLAKRVPEARRAGAATVVWVMMIAGFALTAGIAGPQLDPYTPERLMTVSGVVSLGAVILTAFLLLGLEGRGGTAHAAETASGPSAAADAAPAPRNFREALSHVWADPVDRRFTIFVFLSMLAYSAQDLILEPFAGTVFGLTPGATTQLSGLQHAGVLAGMLLVASGTALGNRVPWLARLGSLRLWTLGGCLFSAAALASLAAGGLAGGAWPLKACVLALGVANGAFCIGAISSMMKLAGAGGPGREGIRMGLWGASQAIAFGLGGLAGTACSDLARLIFTTPGVSYAVVFLMEAGLFLLSAVMASRIEEHPALRVRQSAAESESWPAMGLREETT